MPEEISNLVRGLQRAIEPTDSATFREEFARDPASTLEAKGLVLSADEQSRVNTEVANIIGNQTDLGASATATEVEVSVKVKI